MPYILYAVSRCSHNKKKKEKSGIRDPNNPVSFLPQQQQKRRRGREGKGVPRACPEPLFFFLPAALLGVGERVSASQGIPMKGRVREGACVWFTLSSPIRPLLLFTYNICVCLRPSAKGTREILPVRWMFSFSLGGGGKKKGVGRVGSQICAHKGEREGGERMLTQIEKRRIRSPDRIGRDKTGKTDFFTFHVSNFFFTSR